MIQAKAEAEKEAAQVAARRARDEAAAKIEREKAQAALEKLNAARNVELPKAFDPPVQPVKSKPVVQPPKVEKKPAPVAETPAKKEEKKEPAGGVFGSFFGNLAQPAKPVEKKGKAMFYQFNLYLPCIYLTYCLFAAPVKPSPVVKPEPVKEVAKPVVAKEEKKVEAKGGHRK